MAANVAKILGDEIDELYEILEGYAKKINALEERIKYLEDNTVKYNDEIIFSRPVEPELEDGFRLAMELEGQIKRNK